jgi:hypothetical protein
MNMKESFSSSIEEDYNQLTIRDYFAARAMQSYIALNLPISIEELAGKAYEMADEMLVDRLFES